MQKEKTIINAFLYENALETSKRLSGAVRNNKILGGESELAYDDPEFAYPYVSEMILQRVIEPICDLLAMIHQDEDNPTENPLDKHMMILFIYSQLVGKCHGLAHQVISGFGLPETEAGIMSMTAAITYLLDALADKAQDSNLKKKLVDMIAIFGVSPSDRPEETSDIGDIFGIDALLFQDLRVKLGSEDEKLLRKIIVNHALTIAQSFDAGLPLDNLPDAEYLQGLTEVEKLVRIKVDGVGFHIVMWVGLYTLYKNGLLQENPRILMSKHPELERAAMIGAFLTRFSDDVGDKNEDQLSKVLNITTSEDRDEILSEMYEYCGIGKHRYQAGATDTDVMEMIVNSFNECLQNFERDNPTLLKSTDKSRPLTDVEYVLQILRKTAIISYENYIGDCNQNA